MRRERKRKVLKKTLCIVLSAAMLVSGMTFMPGNAIETHAASPTVKDINFGTGGLGAPTVPTDNNTAWSGSKIYFGCDSISQHNLWRVLDASAGLLFADDVVAQHRYDDSSNDWDSSDLKTWLNGNNYKSNTNLFTTTETGAIEGDVTLLDVSDVKSTSYGFTNDTGTSATRAASAWWWLRSPGLFDWYAVSVNGGGDFNSDGTPVYPESGSVRPAFNLNLGSVLFSSASEAGKSSFALVGTGNVDANTWKLTLKDSSKEISVTNGKTVSKSGQTVTVPYTYTGSDVSQISIMITDKAYTESDASILYYGALDTTIAAIGTGTFTLPTGLSDGYKIYMMAEDVNEATLTDYSSAPVEIVPVTTYALTVNNGTGDGNYVADASVTITADAAPSGQHFKGWTVVNGGVTLASTTSATTTFTMPAGVVEVTATYENDAPVAPTTYAVTVNDGTGDGNYVADASVTITADAAPTPEVVKNKTYTIGKVKYKVTNASTNGFGTVTITGTSSKKITSLTIGSTITINGVKLKVTKIASNAFKGCTKLKQVTIGSNITGIGSKAFYGCKNLKFITIKTTKLTTKNVGSSAFKGIYKKATIKVPKSKLKAYRKLLTKKGVGSKAKIKK